MHRTVVVLFVLFGIFVGHGFSQTPSTASRAQNLRDCMDGFGTCDRSLLTNTQATPVYNIVRISGRV